MPETLLQIGIKIGGPTTGCAGEQSADPASSKAYPVKIGPTGRYLVDQNGAPFLMIGESPQAMIGNLSEATADLFLAVRKRYEMPCGRHHVRWPRAI